MGREEEFLKKRVRLQRLEDLKFFSGWCTYLKGQECSVQLNSEESAIVAGEKFNVEIYGAEKRAVMTAELTGSQASVAHFRIKSSIRLLQSNEESRYLVTDVAGYIYLEGDCVPCKVMDISAHGLGGDVTDEIPRGRLVKFKLLTPHGHINAEATVQNCRKVSPGHYRVGLRLPDLTSLDGTRWMALMHDPIELG